MNNKLQSYNQDTKLFIVYSSHTGETLFIGKVKNQQTRNDILKAIRKGEDMAFKDAKEKMLSILDKPTQQR